MKRFERPSLELEVELDETNQRIVEAVYYNRLVTTDQCQMLVGFRSRDKINARLKSLFAAKYLDRPEIQRSIYAYSPKRPLIHALGDAGARWVRRELELPVPKSVQWARKNRELRDARFIAHKIGEAEVMIRAQLALEALDGFRLIHAPELVACAPPEAMSIPNPFALPTRLSWPDGRSYQRPTEPDRSFGVEDARRDESRRALFFLEWDEDTEPLSRTTPYRSSILQKLLGYADAWQRKLHSARFGYKFFRVLFVTTGGDGRVSGMVNLYQAHLQKACPGGLFFFTTSDAYCAATNPFTEPIWLTGKREQKALVETARV